MLLNSKASVRHHEWGHRVPPDRWTCISTSCYLGKFWIFAYTQILIQVNSEQCFRIQIFYLYTQGFLWFILKGIPKEFTGSIASYAISCAPVSHCSCSFITLASFLIGIQKSLLRNKTEHYYIVWDNDSRIMCMWCKYDCAQHTILYAIIRIVLIKLTQAIVPCELYLLYPHHIEELYVCSNRTSCKCCHFVLDVFNSNSFKLSRSGR